MIALDNDMRDAQAFMHRAFAPEQAAPPGDGHMLLVVTLAIGLAFAIAASASLLAYVRTRNTNFAAQTAMQIAIGLFWMVPILTVPVGVYFVARAFFRAATCKSA